MLVTRHLKVPAPKAAAHYLRLAELAQAKLPLAGAVMERMLERAIYCESLPAQQLVEISTLVDVQE